MVLRTLKLIIPLLVLIVLLSIFIVKDEVEITRRINLVFPDSVGENLTVSLERVEFEGEPKYVRDHWQPLGNSVLRNQIFSAYFDERQEILGIKFHVFCNNILTYYEFHRRVSRFLQNSTIKFNHFRGL
jgi:hypothetical protein